MLQAMVQGRPSVQEAGLSWDDAGPRRTALRGCLKGGGAVPRRLVQVIVHGGEGAGADARASHEGQTLSRLTHRLSHRRLLRQVMSL